MRRNTKKLYKLAYELDLTEFHLTASRILEQINGMKCAENYLKKEANRLKVKKQPTNKQQNKAQKPPK